MRETAIKALEFLFTQPITTIPQMSEKLGKAYNTVQNIMQQFVSHSFVSENIVRTRNKLYRFEPYIRPYA